MSPFPGVLPAGGARCAGGSGLRYAGVIGPAEGGAIAAAHRVPPALRVFMRSGLRSRWQGRSAGREVRRLGCSGIWGLVTLGRVRV